MRFVPLFMALSLSAEALPADTWLVAVANNRGDADDPRLLFAERDAQQLVDAFQANGGVQPRRTTLVLGGDADAVRSTLLEVNARIREKNETSPTALVVFYSGHADAEALHLGGSHLKVEELRQFVEGSAAKMRLLLVDACRSGSVTRVKGAVPAAHFDVKVTSEVTTEGLAMVTSSAAGESSQESDLLRGSFFTHHFVNALRGAADENGDDLVTLPEAYAYTYSQTLRSTGRTSTLQHPTFAYDVKGKGEVVLAQGAQASAAMGKLRLDTLATYIISEGREGGPVVAEVQPTRAGASLTLREGRYFVQQRFPAEYREYELEVAAGRELPLASVPFRSITYDRLVRKRGGGGDGPSSVHGLFLLAGSRGEALLGEGPTTHVQLGTTVDLPWFTVGGRLRGSTLGADPLGTGLLRRHTELGLAFTLQRVVDFEAFSMSFGLLAEGILHRQSFEEGRRIAPTVHTLGGAFGGILSLERALGRGLSFHVEGGPTTLLFEETTLKQGAPVGTELRTTFTWWAAGGVLWRL